MLRRDAAQALPRRAERGEQRVRGRARVADDAEVDRPVGADRLQVAVDLDDAWRPARSARRGAVVHWFSAAPKARITSDSFSSRCGDRGGEAAGDAEVERVAGEQAVGHGGGGQHGAEPFAERAQRRARRRRGPRRGRR